MTRDPAPGPRRVLLALTGLAVLGPLLLLGLLASGSAWHWPALLPSDPDPAARIGVLLSGAGAEAIGRSLGIAAATGVIALLAGFPAGRSIARLPGGWRLAGLVLALLPVATPPIALGVGLQFSLLSAGLGGGIPGVILAHAVPATGYTTLFFTAVFSLLDPAPEEGARTLGATPAQTFLRVTLPILRRPIGEGWILGALVSWGEMPLTLLVGQGRVETLPLQILAHARAGQDSLAAAGGLLLAVPPLLLLAALARTPR